MSVYKEPHLNDDLVDRRIWWACAEPERPHDPFAAYQWACNGCFTALTALVRRGDDHGMHTFGADGTPYSSAALDVIYAEIVAWRIERGLWT